MLYVQEVEKLNGKASGSVIILVTSGDDEHIGSCLLSVLSSGSTVHSIALGSSAARNLEGLARRTGHTLCKTCLFKNILFEWQKDREGEERT